MEVYIVYRLIYNSMLCEPLGELMDRRRKDRVNNTEDLLKLAERMYSPSQPGSNLVITPQ